MTVEKKTNLTINDLHQMGDIWYEIVNGELIYLHRKAGTMSAGFLHNQVGGNFYSILRSYNRKAKEGFACPDGLEYVLHMEGDHVMQSRIPDVSFICKDDMPEDFDPIRPFIGAPILAIEIVDPEDSAIDIMARVDDFLDAGTDEVWLAYPSRQEVYVYRKDDRQTVKVYRIGDVIDSDGLLPGLKVNVSDAFGF